MINLSGLNIGDILKGIQKTQNNAQKEIKTNQEIDPKDNSASSIEIASKSMGVMRGVDGGGTNGIKGAIFDIFSKLVQKEISKDGASVLLQNQNILKNITGFKEEIQNISKMLEKYESLSVEKKTIDNFAKHISQADEKSIRQNIEKSGILLEAKLGMLAMKEVPKDKLLELFNNIKNTFPDKELHQKIDKLIENLTKDGTVGDGTVGAKVVDGKNIGKFINIDVANSKIEDPRNIKYVKIDNNIEQIFSKTAKMIDKAEVADIFNTIPQILKDKTISQNPQNIEKYLMGKTQFQGSDQDKSKSKMTDNVSDIKKFIENTKNFSKEMQNFSRELESLAQKSQNYQTQKIPQANEIENKIIDSIKYQIENIDKSVINIEKSIKNIENSSKLETSIMGNDADENIARLNETLANQDATNQDSTQSSQVQKFKIDMLLKDDVKLQENSKDIIKNILLISEKIEPEVEKIVGEFEKNKEIFNNLKENIKEISPNIFAQIEEKDIVDDLKSAMLKITESLEGGVDSSSKELNSSAQKILTQIDYFQLNSYASSSINTYLPFLWDGLRDGNMSIKKSDSNKFSSVIDLDFEEYGKVKIILIVENQKNIMISVAAQSGELKERIVENLHLLKKSLTNIEANILNVSVFLIKQENQKQKLYEQDDSIDLGLNIQG